MNLTNSCFSYRKLLAPLALWLSVCATSGSATADEDLLQQAIDNNEVASFIVYFTEKADFQVTDTGPGSSRSDRARMIQTLRSLAADSQLRVADLLRSRGAKRLESLWIANALAVTAEAGIINELLELPEIENIAADSLMQAPSLNQAAASTGTWNLDLIGTQDLWALGNFGAGVTVAFMDTGVDAFHVDLNSNYRGGSNSWYDPNGEHLFPKDTNGHGTQVAGLAVGGNASGSPIGVAPESTWIAAKIYDDAGYATTSGIHAAFQWLLDPDGNPSTDDAPDIVNASWGFTSQVNVCGTEYQADIATLRAAGISVVFSAGNSGPYSATSMPPANNSGSLSVGSLDSSSAISSTSSRGPSACSADVYPHVVAPGDNVRTSDLTFSNTVPDNYIHVAGTSAAAPHVAGAIALLRHAHPNANVDLIDAALQATAVDLGTEGPDHAYGAGLIHLQAASAYLGSPPAPECSDSDDDGFFGTADCGTDLDCNDFDSTINPLACDIRRDGIDQDCDGTDRTKGKACPSSDDSGDGGDGGGGEDPIAPEDNRKTCSDGLDNDNDGATDCADSGCSRVKICR